MSAPWLVVVAVASLVLSGCSFQSSPDGAGPGDATSCAASSWVAGTTEVCGGAIIYRDYVYDDHGADTVPAAAGHASPILFSAGDARYPPRQENTADLVRLELRPSGNRLLVTAELNTLYVADSTIVAVAIDTDPGAATGGGPWPGVNGVRSSGWDVAATFSKGDPTTNVIAGDMPLPGGVHWRVQAVTAQADGTVMNLAFRGPDEKVGTTSSAWWERNQAAALASGDVSEQGFEVDVRDVRSGKRIAPEVGPGLHQRVYTSAYTLGEGISRDGVPGRHGDTGSFCEQYFHHLGKYQPYGIYVPKGPGPHGVQLSLHACLANHASLIKGPGMQRQFGDDVGRIIVSPLGRGPVGFYSDISERDVLDVLADVVATYHVDEDRVFVSGYSMGGYGTLRFAALYPDLFAGAVNWVGYTGDSGNTPLPGNPASGNGRYAGAIGNAVDFVGNLRHIPSAHLYGAADELVHISTALALQNRLQAAGVPHHFFQHPTADHVAMLVMDEWAKEAAFTASLRRVADPQRVVYRTLGELEYPTYGIRHDRAYWVSNIAWDDPARFSDVDLHSRGCGGEGPTFKDGVMAGPDPLPWVDTYRERTGDGRGVPENRLTGSLANVVALRIDAARACLEAPGLAYEIVTDGPVRLEIGDGTTIRALTLAAAGTHRGVV